MSNARLSVLQARAVKDKRISDAQFRTLAALGMYADEDGWCFPSLKTLGNDLGKSKQAVGRDTIALRKLGYLEVKSRYNSKTGARHSSLYRLKFDLPPVNVDDSTPSTSDVDTPSTSDVDVNVPVNAPINEYIRTNENFALIASKLSTLTGGALNTSSAPLIDEWLLDHPVEWIIRAIEISINKKKRSAAYVSTILKNWKNDGYSLNKPTKLTEPKGVTVAREWLKSKTDKGVSIND